MSLEVVGELRDPLDTIVKEALHKALDARPGGFVVHVSQPHGELIVHVKTPFDRRLKFNPVSDFEIGRELITALSAIADEELKST
jgi:hypothetical protein